jgi:hypothetical protein
MSQDYGFSTGKATRLICWKTSTTLNVGYCCLPVRMTRYPNEDAADIAGRIPACSRFANAGHGVFRNDRQRCTKSSASSSSAKPEFMPAPTFI